MIKLNVAHYPTIEDINISKEYSLDILKNNELYYDVKKSFLDKYSFSNLLTFSFNPNGFLSLLCELKNKGKVAISVGETNAVVEAGKLYEKLGFEVIWIGLNKNGSVNFEDIIDQDISFLFISSYVMDTFVKTDLEEIRKTTNAIIISNATVEYDISSDVIYFDPYKLVGSNTSGVILHNELFTDQAIGYIDNIALYLITNMLKKQKFTTTLKSKFKKKLEEVFDSDIYYFVNDTLTLGFTLHIALKGIKARELIRTLSLDEILITNGEGCSLGLSQPSKIIQAMGYDEEISRNGISLSFSQDLDDTNIEKVCKLFYRRYRQIKVLT
ncbi:cysteine desulfurase [Arcobacteraceae bacterium]|nr:cysteine desulfurase [Arcobacteraceae bacterium]